MDIIRACEIGDIDLVKKLYKENDNKNNLFRWACWYGHVDIAKWLYSLGGVDIHAENEEAFRFSCCNGHMEIAKWLYNLGEVDIYARNEGAFILSCINGHKEISKWLYSLGEVDIHAENGYAFRFTYGYEYGHMKTAKWLYNLDKKILVNAIEDIDIQYEELGIDKETSKIIKMIKKKERCQKQRIQ